MKNFLIVLFLMILAGCSAGCSAGMHPAYYQVNTPGVQAVTTQTTPTTQEQLQAMADARRDAKQDFDSTKWGCMGGFGAIGLAASAMHEPPVPLHRLQGKSETYILYYKQEYVQEMKRLQSSSAFNGWVNGMIFVFAGIAILTLMTN